MKNSDLKPCPFCGKSVKFTNHTGDYGYTPDTVGISCCSTRIRAATQGWERAPGRGHYGRINEARQEVADKWNVRA